MENSLKILLFFGNNRENHPNQNLKMVAHKLLQTNIKPFKAFKVRISSHWRERNRNSKGNDRKTLMYESRSGDYVYVCILSSTASFISQSVMLIYYDFEYFSVFD